MATLYRTYGRDVPMEVILRTRNFAGMHPTMQERVRALLEASDGRAGWGNGLRTPQEQLRVFLSHHRVDPNGKVEFNGERYTLVASPAAKPGRSMHEVGLAADLRGEPTSNPRIDDCRWVVENAPRFGLVTFADVNNEPWHVQPAELAHARRDYEAKGAAWGAYPNYRGVAAGSGNATAEVPALDAAKTMQVAQEIAAAGLAPALVARLGDGGPAARVLIEALIARGLLADDPSSRDREYGAADVEIVKQFQRDNGLGDDGEVGPKTWGKLLKVIEPGEDSPMVRALKAVLIVRSIIKDSDANMGSDYGPLTQHRVRDFQSLSGIDPIAKVGPQTWTALLGAKSKVAVSDRGEETDEPTFDDVDLDDLDLVALLEDRPAT